MNKNFRLLMLSAMYENGGNTTHRFIDGHPQMFVYPFESQLGTRYVNDLLSSMYPQKYRWPEFPLSATPYEDYKTIIDEEAKVRARTPQVSKFRHVSFEMNDDERCEIYQQYIQQTGRSRAHNVAAFYRATFDAWKNCQRTNKEIIYVGYSPIVVVDVAKIFEDLHEAHVLHVVRNPWSAYADTKKRPVPLSLSHYMLGWTMNQYYALYYQKKFPKQVHIVRIEDVVADPYKILGKICRRLGLEPVDALKKTTWNGVELEEVYPWGTLRKATPEANNAAAEELSEQERIEIRDYA